VFPPPQRTRAGQPALCCVQSTATCGVHPTTTPAPCGICVLCAVGPASLPFVRLPRLPCRRWQHDARSDMGGGGGGGWLGDVAAGVTGRDGCGRERGRSRPPARERRTDSVSPGMLLEPQGVRRGAGGGWLRYWPGGEIRKGWQTVGCEPQVD
jgi:hypothetical protein